METMKSNRFKNNPFHGHFATLLEVALEVVGHKDPADSTGGPSSGMTLRPGAAAPAAQRVVLHGITCPARVPALPSSGSVGAAGVRLRVG